MVLSIHIPKTAGVSIRNILKDHFGPGFVSFYWKLTDAWGHEMQEVPQEATCVHGHYPTDHLTARFPYARLITWVRDPVERVVSSYHHRMRDPDWQHPVCRELHEKKLSLVEYAALPLVRNEMSQFFGSKSPEDFLFIGIVEQFEQSFCRMKRLLGITSASVLRDNVNPEKNSASYELAPEVRRRIQELNEKDVLLYSSCLQRWGNGPL